MKAPIGTYPKDRQLLYEKVPFDTPLVVDFFVSNVCNFRCGYCLQSSPEEVIKKSGLCRRLMDMPNALHASHAHPGRAHRALLQRHHGV